MNALIKTGKTLFNALAFANAGNYSEFRMLLRQIDETAGSTDEQANYRTATSDKARMTPAMQDLQHAA
jgi:hypothetical protein